MDREQEEASGTEDENSGSEYTGSSEAENGSEEGILVLLWNTSTCSSFHISFGAYYDS